MNSRPIFAKTFCGLNRTRIKLFFSPCKMSKYSKIRKKRENSVLKFHQMLSINDGWTQLLISINGCFQKVIDLHNFHIISFHNTSVIWRRSSILVKRCCATCRCVEVSAVFEFSWRGWGEVRPGHSRQEAISLALGYWALIMVSQHKRTLNTPSPRSTGSVHASWLL